MKQKPNPIDLFTPEIQMGYLQKLMELNQNKNFVKRVLDPDNSPYLDLGNGQRATHKMAWGEGDGKYFMYPTVIQDGKKLKQLDNKSAWQYAIKNKEFIEFNNEEEADWVSRNYKMLWNKK